MGELVKAYVSKPDHLSLIPWTHMVEENQLKVVVWSHMHVCTFPNTYTN